MKKLFTLIFGLLMAQWALAATEVNGVYYNLDTSAKTATVTHCPWLDPLGSYKYQDNYLETFITIPASIVVANTEYTVIGISDFAFCSSHNLGNIIIEAPITSVGERAFTYCVSLVSLTLPKGLLSIGDFAFEGCTNLTSLTLPEGLTSIGQYAFRNCSQLASINIPNGVTEIPDYCFWGCESLSSVTLPEGLTSIGQYAFFYCLQLASINIPDGVTEIPDYCFYSCESLSSLTLPEGLTSIGETAFLGCSQLASINIPDSVTEILDNCFQSCTSLTSLTLPEGLLSIGNAAFYDCTQLASINIPDGVTEIPGYCFRGSSLTSLTLPEGVTSIGQSAFALCTQLAELTVLNPEPPTLDDYSLPGTSYLKTVYVPRGAKAAYQAAEYWKDYNIEELPAELTGYLEVEDFAIEAGSTAETALSFVGELGKNNYPGFQFFMNLPEGISVSDIELSETLTSAGFQLSHNNLTENPVKVVVYNMTGASTGETENLLNITFSAADNAPNGESVINLTNAYLSTIMGEDIPLDDSQTTVTISNIPVSSFKITPDNEADIYVGQTCSFTATVLPENATNKEFTWSLDVVVGEEPVVEIVTNENGEITVKGLRRGTATLTATAADYMGATAKATVNVVATPAQSVTVSAEDMILLVGTTGQLTATVSPEDTTDKTITWSTENDAIATVSNDGLVTAVAPGTVNIKATCGEVSGTCEVTVKAIDSVTVKPGNGEDDDDDDNTTEGDDNKTPGENTENGMSVSGSDLTLRVGQKGSITLAIEPGVNYDPQLVWTLANGGEAYVKMTVSEKNTLTASFEGLSVGATTYTVSTPANQTAILTGKINVIAENPVMSLTVSPEEISLPKNAPAYQLTATITPDVVTNGTLSWTSSAPDVATVDASGNVTPVGEGECVITVATTDGTGLTATSKVTITAPVDDNFTFEFDDEVMGGAEAISIYIGSTYQFKPKAHDGYVLPDVIEWSSSDATTVSVEEDGTIHGLQLGKATITATATVNGKTVTAKCEVTVIAIPAASITIDGGGVKAIKQTETLELKAIVLPEDTTDPTVTWESSDNAIATVSEEGVVTGVEPGQVTITAYVTAQPDVKATYDITVGKLLLGDSNDNGVVTVADVVTTANYLIELPVNNWCFVNADVIGDGKITTADVTATVDIIINDTDYMSRRSARSIAAEYAVDRLVADNFLNGQNETRIDVKLDNSMAYTALMATIAIPQGMKVKDVVKGPRAADHALMYNINAAGDLKIVLFSYSNTNFSEGDDALFTIVASTEGVTGNIEMFNIIASDAASTDYDLGYDGGLNEAGTTGIESTGSSDDIIILAVAEGVEILNAQGRTIRVYSLNGQVIYSLDSADDYEKVSLQRGIYIVTAGQKSEKVIIR